MFMKMSQDIKLHGCVQYILLEKATSLHFGNISITTFYTSSQWKIIAQNSLLCRVFHSKKWWGRGGGGTRRKVPSG